MERKDTKHRQTKTFRHRMKITETLADWQGLTHWYRMTVSV